MRMQNHSNKLDTNIKVVSQDFGIGDASVIIEILRNRLYEHPIRTLVQEYICNGRDANREAGSKRRLQVTIPNDISPVFKVRDFGPGISPDRIANVFVKYGASTKRDTNNQTGGFGIGAKSAWSYTDSFSIITFVDGVQRTYVAHTGVNNQGRLDLISEVETSETNGTEIHVAVKRGDMYNFRNAVYRAVYFWEASEMPELKGVTSLDNIPSHNPFIKVSDTIEILKGDVPDFLGVNYYGKLILNIDGVVYPVDRGLCQKVESLEEVLDTVNGKIVVKISNGVVDVSASRESIADSEQTRKALDTIGLEVSAKLASYIKDRFATCKDFKAWADTYAELERTLSIEEHATFGKYSVNSRVFQHEDFSKIIIKRVMTTGRKCHKVDFKEVRGIDINCTGSVFFEGTTESNRAKVHGRLRDYLNGKNTTAYILEVREPVADPDKKLGVQPTKAESIKALARLKKDFQARDFNALPYTPPVRVPREKRDRAKEAVTLHIIRGGGKSPNSYTVGHLEEKAEKWLYIDLKDFDSLRTELYNLGDLIHEEGFRICAITDKTLKAVKGSKLFKSYADWKASFKPDAKLISGLKYEIATNKENLEVLKRSTVKVKDKLVLKMIDEYQGLKQHNAVNKFVIEMFKDTVEDFAKNEKQLAEKFKTQYPLVSSVVRDRSWGVNKELSNELVVYMNAKE